MTHLNTSHENSLQVQQLLCNFMEIVLVFNYDISSNAYCQPYLVSDDQV